MENEIIEFLKKELKEYDPQQHQVKVTALPDGFQHVHYHTVWHNDFSDRLGHLPILSFLGSRRCAFDLRQITITAEDEGVNGTQNWDLASFFAEDEVLFSLRSLSLPMNERNTHNRRIVTLNDSYDENGAFMRLLLKCPDLRDLSIPSAPDPTVFEGREHALINLDMQTGYDHHSFIWLLSQNPTFPALSRLIFRDYAETYMADYKDNCTPFQYYLALAQSFHVPMLKHITLLDTVLTDEQKEEIREGARQFGRVVEFGTL